MEFSFVTADFSLKVALLQAEMSVVENCRQFKLRSYDLC